MGVCDSTNREKTSIKNTETNKNTNPSTTKELKNHFITNNNNLIMIMRKKI